MEERIYVKNKADVNIPEEGSSSVGKFIIPFLALLLVVGGAIGLILNANSSNNTPPESIPIKSETTDDSSDEDGIDDDTSDVPQDSTSDDQTSDDDGVDDSSVDQAGPPEDETKVHIYLPKNGTLMPVLRDKQDNVPLGVILDIISGPTAEEKADGYTSVSSFTGDSACEGNKLFSFGTQGNTLNLNLCKQYSGNDKKLFSDSVTASLTELNSIENVKIYSPDGSCFTAGGC